MQVFIALRRIASLSPTQAINLPTARRALRKNTILSRLNTSLILALALASCTLAPAYCAAQLIEPDVTAKTGTLALYPNSAAVYVRSQQVFQAQLSTVPDGNQLTYSVDGVTDGNAATGTITNQGVYTAPPCRGHPHRNGERQRTRHESDSFNYRLFQRRGEFCIVLNQPPRSAAKSVRRRAHGLHA